MHKAIYRMLLILNFQPPPPGWADKSINASNAETQMQQFVKFYKVTYAHFLLYIYPQRPLFQGVKNLNQFF